MIIKDSLCTRSLYTTRRKLFVLVAGFVLSGLFLSRAEAGARVFVDPGGAAGYEIPIVVPPGIRGLTPILSLVYSDDVTAAGSFGSGWSLRGVQYISRCPNRKLIDGVALGPVYSTNDKLCLNGERLVQTDSSGLVVNAANMQPTSLTPFQISDSLGLSGCREFRTAIDGYSRIRACGMLSGQPGNGPAYFKMWAKDGLVYEFGNNSNPDANSVVPLSGTSAVADSWLLSRVSDAYGNYVNYYYAQRDVAFGSSGSGRDWALQMIRYTGTSTSAPQNRIIFDLGDAADNALTPQARAESYRSGSKKVTSWRVNSISAYINTPSANLQDAGQTPILVSKMGLGYVKSPSTGRLLLSSAAVCSDVGMSVCLPAETFSYAPGGSDAYTPSAAFSSGSLASATLVRGDTWAPPVQPLIGDFNGDGFSDIATFSTAAAYNHLYLNNRSGGFVEMTNSGLDVPSYGQYCTYTWVTADVNGDGVDDIIRTYSGVGGGCSPNRVYINSGSGSFAAANIAGISLPKTQLFSQPSFNCTSSGCKLTWTDGWSHTMLDANSDGKVDILISHLPAQTSYIDPSTFNGCQNAVCSWLYVGDGAGGFSPVTTNLANVNTYVNNGASPSALGGAKKHLIDVNGDGLADLVEVGELGDSQTLSNVAIWLSQGDGNFVARVKPSARCTYRMDFNGDGLPDCLQIKLKPGDPQLQYDTTGASTLFAETGSSLAQANAFNLMDSTSGLANLQRYVYSHASNPGAFSADVEIADFDGDGREDALLVGVDGALFLSNGDGSFRRSTAYNIQDKVPVGSALRGYFVGNFCGGSSVDILTYGSLSAPANSLYCHGAKNPLDRLVAVTDGGGIRTDVSRTPLDLGVSSGRYKSDIGTADKSIYPQADVAATASAFVVSTVTRDTGIGSSRLTEEYAYSGLKRDAGDPGSHGFREVRQQLVAADGSAIVHRTRYLQDRWWYGQLSSEDVWLGSLGSVAPSSPLRTAANIYCDQTAAAGAAAAALASGAPCLPASVVRRPYLLRSVNTQTELDGSVGPSTTASWSYDMYGNVLTEAVVVAGTTLGVNQAVTRSTTNTYFPAITTGDLWQISLLSNQAVNTTAPDFLPSTTAGSAPLATATTGTGSPPPPAPQALSPAVLSVILQLLLED